MTSVTVVRPVVPETTVTIELTETEAKGLTALLYGGVGLEHFVT